MIQSMNEKNIFHYKINLNHRIKCLVFKNIMIQFQLSQINKLPTYYSWKIHSLKLYRQTLVPPNLSFFICSDDNNLWFSIVHTLHKCLLPHILSTLTLSYLNKLTPAQGLFLILSWNTDNTFETVLSMYLIRYLHSCGYKITKWIERETL